jgi:hypothetical protein
MKISNWSKGFEQDYVKGGLACLYGKLLFV